MYLKQIIATLIVGLAILVSPAMAQDASQARLQAAEKLVSETITSGMVENMIANVWPPLEANLREKNPDITPEALDGLKEDLANQQRKLISEIIVDMPAIYAKYFTLEELEQILAFQTSPAGKKVLEVQPKIMGEIMPTMLRTIQEEMPAIMERLKQKAQEKGYKL